MDDDRMLEEFLLLRLALDNINETLKVIAEHLNDLTLVEEYIEDDDDEDEDFVEGQEGEGEQAEEVQ